MSRSMTTQNAWRPSFARSPERTWGSSGGASLFRSLAQRGLVDTVEVAVIPVPAR